MGLFQELPGSDEAEVLEYCSTAGAEQSRQVCGLLWMGLAPDPFTSASEDVPPQWPQVVVVRGFCDSGVVLGSGDCL